MTIIEKAADPVKKEPAAPETNLTRGAIHLLRSALEQKGWAERLDQIYQGGKLIDRIDAEYPDPPPTHNVDSFNAWSISPIYFSFSDNEKKAARECLEWHASQKALAPSSHVVMLLDVLGVTFEE